MTFALLLALCSVMISHAGLALVIIFAERRAFRLSERTMTFLIGDLFLAAAVFVGALARDADPLFTPWLILTCLVAIVFGYWQIGHEIRRGVHSPAAAWSPSKLYHQFIIYPVLFSLLTMTAMMAWGDWSALGVMAALWAVWFALGVRDQKLNKQTHIEYDWTQTRLYRMSVGSIIRSL